MANPTIGNLLAQFPRLQSQFFTRDGLLTRVVMVKTMQDHRAYWNMKDNGGWADVMIVRLHGMAEDPNAGRTAVLANERIRSVGDKRGLEQFVHYLQTQEKGIWKREEPPTTNPTAQGMGLKRDWAVMEEGAKTRFTLAEIRNIFIRFFGKVDEKRMRRPPLPPSPLVRPKNNLVRIPVRFENGDAILLRSGRVLCVEIPDPRYSEQFNADVTLSRLADRQVTMIVFNRGDVREDDVTNLVTMLNVAERDGLARNRQAVEWLCQTMEDDGIMKVVLHTTRSRGHLEQIAAMIDDRNAVNWPS